MFASLKKALAAAKAEVEKLAAEVTGEARKELEAALATLEAAEEQIKALVVKYEGCIEKAIAEDEPEVKAELEALAKKLVAEILAILTEAGVE